jgi:hypothetical protein
MTEPEANDKVKTRQQQEKQQIEIWSIVEGM